MVQAELIGGEYLTAILATVLIACEEISAIESQGHRMLPVEANEPHDARNLNFKTDGPHPIIMRISAFHPHAAQLTPAGEVVGIKLTFLDVDDFRDLAEKQNEGVPSGDDSDRLKMSV